MSRMADYYIEQQTKAIRYLAAQGIDEELLWDAAENNYERIIELADQHKEANGRITRVIEQALLAIIAVDRHEREVVIA